MTASGPPVSDGNLERRVGQIVVRGVEYCASGVGQGENSSGTAASTRSVDTLFPGLDMTSGEQHVEVATYARRG